MTIQIPDHCHIRWQAALAVIEDLLEDSGRPFNMTAWGDADTKWEGKHNCGTPTCFAGYISVSPYCKELGLQASAGRLGFGSKLSNWLMGTTYGSIFDYLYRKLFSADINLGSRAKTLRYLERTIKRTFKESTGKTLTAPTTFWIEADE